MHSFTSNRYLTAIAAALAVIFALATASPAHAGKLYNRPVNIGTGGTNLAIFNGTAYYNVGILKLNGTISSTYQDGTTAIVDYRRQYRRAWDGARINGGTTRVSTQGSKKFYSGSLRPAASWMSHYRLKVRVCWWQPGKSSCSDWTNATPWVRTR